MVLIPLVMLVKMKTSISLWRTPSKIALQNAPRQVREVKHRYLATHVTRSLALAERVGGLSRIQNLPQTISLVVVVKAGIGVAANQAVHEAVRRDQARTDEWQRGARLDQYSCNWTLLLSVLPHDVHLPVAKHEITKHRVFFLILALLLSF
jgi:hypothetical protein